MKRFALILLGCALIMGMSQCKKDNTTNNESVRITLTADGGQNSKTSFDGTNFTWTDKQTEYIYVGCSRYAGCIGELTATGNGTSRVTFSGSLSPAPVDGDKLYFFYLGNGRHNGVTTVSFASQTGILANVTDHHIAIGVATYNGSESYTATLNMAMAIARFDTHLFSESPISLSGEGIYNTATINYQEGTITEDVNGSIAITNGPSDDCYVALLPHHTVGNHTLTFTDGSQSGGIIFKQEIYAGDFYESLTGGTPGPLVVTPSSGK